MRRMLGRAVLTSAALLMVGCATAWHPVPIAMADSEPARAYGRARLVRRGGDTVDLATVRVRPDSLFGIRADAARAPVAVAMSDVARLERRASEPAPAVAPVTRFAVGVLAGVGRFLGTFAACLALRVRAACQ